MGDALHGGAAHDNGGRNGSLVAARRAGTI
jgi:hypothetical protein